ncbi:MAG: riboflavin synthase subunit alpha [Aquincola sp.]|nr:riboflavin synthase subunit alpha [Aquincola sp.]MDH4288119.1 riboflavin synthase subunit alpha [Aquincola sp.]MDH5329217.1 riboflavin synthase subunit alpha [Aquincola sp.]
MFTGIVQGIAHIARIADRSGLRTLRLAFPAGFDAGLQIGASVAVDGVCLTVTALHVGAADFDVMSQTLALTTLGGLDQGAAVNVERAAKEGAEVGGHVLSGHIDCRATLTSLRTPENNRVLRMALSPPWMRYVFAKGYVAVNGASLTVAEVQRAPDGSGWFEVWLIPETLRLTTFGDKREGDTLNVEIDRHTQVIVDTVREAVDARLGPYLAMLDALARERGASGAR